MKLILPGIMLLAVAAGYWVWRSNTATGVSQMNGDQGLAAKEMERSKEPDSTVGTEKATFAGGCFWCTEAVFLQLKGVKSVVSGYTGGKTLMPTYAQICNGDTGHAEAIQIVFDPKLVSFDDLLEAFWKTHDPTTLNRQGNDVGTQYRSAIFYHSDDQKSRAEKYKSKLDADNAFGSPIVTEITPAAIFYPAEKEHQDYYARNGRQPYCQSTVRPKVEKIRKVFADKLKD